MKGLKRGAWTKDEIAYLKRFFPGYPTATLAGDMGRPVEAVKKKASRMGLKKSRKYLKTLGRV